MKWLKFALAIIAGTCVISCTTIRISEENISKIKKLKLPEPAEIQFPPGRYFVSNGDAIISAMVKPSVLYHPSGIPEHIKKSPEDSYIYHLLNNSEPSLRDVFLDKLKSNIDEVGLYQVTNVDDYDAKIEIIITRFQLHPIIFTKSFRPTIFMEAKMVNRAGKTLWKYEFNIPPANNIVKMERKKKWFEEENLLKNAFSAIADHQFKVFAKHMAGMEVTKKY